MVVVYLQTWDLTARLMKRGREGGTVNGEEFVTILILAGIAYLGMWILYFALVALIHATPRSRD
jgi:hypothetical protein